MEDERLLLSSPAEAPAVVAQWAAAGVDVVRIHARWGELAPGSTSAGARPASTPPIHATRRYQLGASSTARSRSCARTACG